MPSVVLLPITPANFAECRALQVADEQTGLVASTVQSLAEAYVGPTLTPLGVYDQTTLGRVEPDSPMVGFTMYERKAGVGFILRLLIGQEFQHRDYGIATMEEVIRRLRLCPDVQRIATSYQTENHAAAQLYQQLGFQPWAVPWPNPEPHEVYVMLPDDGF